MKLKDLLAGIEIKSATADLDQEIRGLAYDSRSVEPGDLFVAVTGYAADGHAFIPMAVARGAAAVLCQVPPDGDIPYVQVENTRYALAQASANFFGSPAKRMKFVGVTGTNGKTTTTYLLKTVLERTGAKVGLVGTIQNMIGDRVVETERTTPESFELQKLFSEMAAAGCTHVVMEVSSHALALDRVAGIHFDVGVFTNLTEDHLDFHGTMEAYQEAKALLFTRCDRGVFNLDDPACGTFLKQASCQCMTYGEQAADADLRATDVALHAGSVAFTAAYRGAAEAVHLGIPGGFTVYNALAVIGAALSLGIPLDTCAAALETARGVKGRVEVVPTPGEPYTVLIDYAHSPDGLENVLRSVRGFCRGRVIAVFGCGGDRDPFKRPIMGEIGARLSDFVVVTSDNPRTEDPMKIIHQILEGMRDTKTPYVVEENRRKAIRYAMDIAKQDDIVVLAGKGHETYQILGTEKTHLDEREEVAAHLREKRGTKA